MKAYLSILAAALLLLLPTSAAARRGFFVDSPKTSAAFTLHATNGYRVTVSATTPGGKRVPMVYVQASKGQRSVLYSPRGRFTADGTIDAKLPGVGRIAVRFYPTKVAPEELAENCKGRIGVIYHGVFRGTIELHGELGYTTVHRSRASGTVTQAFRQVCDTGETGFSEGSFDGQETLFAGTEGGGQPRIGFFVDRIDFGPSRGGTSVSFTADATMRRAGIVVFSSVTANGNPLGVPTAILSRAWKPGPSNLRLPSRLGELPAQLPTSSTWSGTLRVSLPGVGAVALAGRLLVGSLQGKRLHQDPAPQCPGHFLGSCRPRLRKHRPSRLRDSDPLETGALSSPMSARWAVSCPASPRSRATSGERFASRRSLTRQPRRARALAPRPLRRALHGLRLPTDIVVVGARYAEDWANVRGSVVHAALSQGRVLAG